MTGSVSLAGLRSSRATGLLHLGAFKFYMFYAVIIQMTDITPESITPLRNDKRERKHTAQSLPPGITHNMMKKFVVYYREMTYLKSGKQQPREYFKVESHPKLSKPWISSKSMKIPLLEKLNDANQIVVDLESQPEKETEQGETTFTEYSIIERWTKQLPKYTTLRVGTPGVITLVYDRKDNHNGFRWTSSHTFSIHSVKDADTTITVAIMNLREKLQNKYKVDIVSI